MSDHSQGEGWWLASDGKWYPPESQPGQQLPPPPTVTPIGNGAVQVAKPKTRRGFVIALVVIVGGFMVLGALGSQDSDGSAGSFDEDRWEAHAICADFTRDRLKAPSSADFPEYDDRGVTITSAGSTWTVRSFVDAQNSFGADIRTSFTCVILDVGDQWRLEEWSER